MVAVEYVVFYLDNVTKIPSITEPLFMAMDAKVEFMPCFTPEELAHAEQDIKDAGQKYG